MGKGVIARLLAWWRGDTLVADMEAALIRCVKGIEDLHEQVAAKEAAIEVLVQQRDDAIRNLWAVVEFSGQRDVVVPYERLSRGEAVPKWAMIFRNEESKTVVFSKQRIGSV